MPSQCRSTEPLYRRAIPLLEADVGDELVALDADSGLCFGFNSVAASVWRLLEEPKSGSQIKASLSDSYAVTPERCSVEVDKLLDTMVEHGIVSRHLE